MREASRDGRRGYGGGAPCRAGGAAGRASRSPVLPPRLLPRRLRRPLLPLLPSATHGLRPPCPRPALSGCASPWTLCGACSRRPRWARTRTPPRRPARPRTGTRRPPPRCARSFACLRVIRRRYQRRARRGVGIELGLHVLVRRGPRSLHAQLLEQEGAEPSPAALAH